MNSSPWADLRKSKFMESLLDLPFSSSSSGSKPKAIASAAAFFAFCVAVRPVPSRRLLPLPNAWFSEGRLEESGTLEERIFCSSSSIPVRITLSESGNLAEES